MTDPIVFLEARIAWDEETARDASQGYWKLVPGDAGEYDGILSELQMNDRYHAEQWDPPRALAECAAKREILAEHQQTTFTNVGLGLENVSVCIKCHNAMDVPDWADEDDWAYPLVQDAWPCRTIRAVLLPFATHPDYDPAWRL